MVRVLENKDYRQIIRRVGFSATADQPGPKTLLYLLRTKAFVLFYRTLPNMVLLLIMRFKSVVSRVYYKLERFFLLSYVVKK